MGISFLAGSWVVFLDRVQARLFGKAAFFHLGVPFGVCEDDFNNCVEFPQTWEGFLCFPLQDLFFFFA